MKLAGRLAVVVVMALGSQAQANARTNHEVVAAPVPLTIVHTNDLHSHLRPERTVLGLGGIARIKTAVDHIRAQAPNNTLVVDGGDWSEGNAYYMLGTGRETIKTMDMIGYDVAVVGNHDWLNGPDRLLDAIEGSQTHMSFVAANADVSNYAQADRFRRLIPPYVIRQVGNAKVAFIGVITYEKMYDSFFKPVGIQEPFLPIAKLATDLKKQVDAVVVISHNSILLNKVLLQTARDVDLVIGAHDHVKLTEPIVVNRPFGTSAWIVETGCWGRYLGRVDLTIEPRAPGKAPKIHLLNYGLTQMDDSVPEDLGVLARVTQLEQQLESLYRAPIFHDHVADVDVDLTRASSEPIMGDMAADAYREAEQAEVAFDNIQFIYGEIHPGAMRTVDALNAAPAIYNPETGKSWTIHTLPMSGREIRDLLALFYSTSTAANELGIVTSGLELTFSPLARESEPLGSENQLPTSIGFPVPNFSRAELAGVVQDLKIGGQVVDLNKKYVAAIGGGILAGFQFLDSLGFKIVSLDGLQDSGREGWRIITDYLAKNSPVLSSLIPTGNRTRSLQPDLSVTESDVRSQIQGLDSSGNLMAHVSVTVRNVGATAAPAGAMLELATSAAGTNTAVTPTLLEVSPAQVLPAIPAGGQVTYGFDVALKGDRGVYRMDALVTNNSDEVIHSNDSTTIWLRFGS